MKEHLLEYIDKAKSQGVRGLRILTEYFYATEIFDPIVKSGIKIVSVFGSARRKPGTWEYEEAKKLGGLLYRHGYAVVTGASAGIMQAANEGVAQAIVADLRNKKRFKNNEELVKSGLYRKTLNRYSVGLKITLPFEPENNPFVGVHASFHYFMVRKFFFGTLSSAFIACEGGWGTRDELFEMLTLVQTGKAPLLPIIYISLNPRHLLDDMKYSLDKGYISEDDLALLQVVSDYKQAVQIINTFYSVVDKISYEKPGMIEISTVKKISPGQKKTLEKVVTKQFSGHINSVEIFDRKFVLNGFRYKSYGVVRKIIDTLCE